MTPPEKSYTPRGVLVQVEGVSGDGEHQVWGEFVVTIEPDGAGDDQPTIELKLGDRKNTVWWIRLSELEGALKLLKRRLR